MCLMIKIILSIKEMKVRTNILIGLKKYWAFFKKVIKKHNCALKNMAFFNINKIFEAAF